MQPTNRRNKTTIDKFQSMHPIKDATGTKRRLQRLRKISIHAPYKGCNITLEEVLQCLLISIHAPYKGCNKILLLIVLLIKLFQSMHPIKDATTPALTQNNLISISIHAPYKGCNKENIETIDLLIISIHAPYKGCNKKTLLRLCKI